LCDNEFGGGKKREQAEGLKSRGMTNLKNHGPKCKPAKARYETKRGEKQSPTEKNEQSQKRKKKPQEEEASKQGRKKTSHRTEGVSTKALNAAKGEDLLWEKALPQDEGGEKIEE